MNMLSSLTGAGSLSLLEQWALQCNEVPMAKLPRAVLEICQIIADEQPSADLATQIARKRRVFERIAIGDITGAIRAMIPEGCEVEMLGKRGGSFAIIKSLNGVDVRSAGPTKEKALLGAVIQLAIRQSAGDRMMMFGNPGADEARAPGDPLAA